MRILFLLVSILYLLSHNMIANPLIELDSEFSDGKLVPIIKINHAVVMRIKGRGPDHVNFPSNFARAQHIYSLLLDLSEKGFDLRDITITRQKSDEFTGEIKGLVVFTITDSDLEGTGKTAYQMGEFWASNIAEAVDRSIDSVDSIPIDKSEYPFLYILNIFGASKLLYILIQIIIIIMIQIGTSYLLIRKLDSTKRLVNQIEKLDSLLSSQQLQIQLLTEELKSVQKTDSPQNAV